MDYKTISYKAQNSVVIITLDRPDALNALNEEMREGLKSALLEAAEDEAVRVVILTGAGRAFCAGADLERFKQEYEHFILTGEASRFYDVSLPRILAFFPKPILAAVNGPAVGVGMTMALSCDIRLASESASFSCPFTRIGLTPEFGSAYFLPRLVGYPKATEWVLTSRMITVQEALATGLISGIAPPDVDVLDEARKMACTIAAMPETAILQSKKILRRSMDLNLNETLEEEARIFQDCQKEHAHYVAVTEMMEQIRGK